ncbi:MAG: sirohydrochlorin chelatase [bacterium]
MKTKLPGRVLLVIAHGSQSAEWNRAVVEFCSRLRDTRPWPAGIEKVQWCFLEHEPPDIPTTLNEHFRNDGRELAVLPLFLSAGRHVARDIPQEIGQFLPFAHRREGLAVYGDTARRVLLLDPPPLAGLIAGNLERRIRRMRLNMEGAGLMVVYYGSRNFMAEWEALAGEVQALLERRLPRTVTGYAYAGFGVDFSPVSLAESLKAMRDKARPLVVVPALVAVGVVQNKIIPAAIRLAEMEDQVIDPGDAMLPDPEMEKQILAHVEDTLSPPSPLP